MSLQGDQGRVREGGDISVITWGAMVKGALDRKKGLRDGTVPPE